MHRDERLFQTVHQSSELWLKLAVLRDRGGDRAHRRATISCSPCACSAAPITASILVDRRAARARAPLALGVPRAAQGARPRQRLRLAGLAAAAAPRPAALGGVHGAARPQRPRAQRRLRARAPSTPSLYDLAEALIEFDERIAIWRSVHVKMVQRVIGGGAIGTQGTPVAVLAGHDHEGAVPAALGRPQPPDGDRRQLSWTAAPAGAALTRLIAVAILDQIAATAGGNRHGWSGCAS